MKIRKDFDQVITAELVGTFLFVFISWTFFNSLMKVNLINSVNLLHHMGIVTFLLIFCL